MVAGFLPATDFALYPRRAEHRCRISIQQEMVNADAGIASVRIAEIVPERIDRLSRIELPNGIGPTLGKEFLISGTRLRKKKSIIDPALRLISIQFHGDDVVVAGQNHRLIEPN